MRLLPVMLLIDSKVSEQLDQMHDPRRLPFEGLLGGFSLAKIVTQLFKI
jgi:hypothetical protein